MNKKTKNCSLSEILGTRIWFYALKDLLFSFFVFHKISFWLDTDRAVLIPALWPDVLFRSDCSHIILLYTCEVIFKLFFLISLPFPYLKVKNTQTLSKAHHKKGNKKN